MTNSPYAQIMDGLRVLLARRLRAYRVATCTIACLATGACVAAALFGWRMLAALGLLAPCVVALLLWDRLQVGRWLSRALALWSTGAVDMNILSATLARMPGIPAATLQGIIALLPRWPSGPLEPEARVGIGLARTRVHRASLAALAGRLLAVSLCATAVSLCVWSGDMRGLWMAILLTIVMEAAFRFLVSSARRVATHEACVALGSTDAPLSELARRWLEQIARG